MQENSADHSDEASTGAFPLEPPLDAEEARVLGCLIEKESTTPEAYPLTQNACVTASNQKTSRLPVMKLDPGRVGMALRKLEDRDLVKSDFGARAARFRHRVDTALELTPGQRALIGLLLLRGPQTLAELFTRTERIHRFDDLDDVDYNLERLAGRTPAFVVRLPRAPGQREDRFMHRLSGEPDVPIAGAAQPVTPSTVASTPDAEVLDRLAELERRVAELESQISQAEN
ncbi:MAG: YceH family protein [Pseudomonadota bacterium]